MNSNPLIAIPRKRLETKAGISSKGEIISEEQFIDYQDEYGEDSFSAAIGAEAIDYLLQNNLILLTY